MDKTTIFTLVLVVLIIAAGIQTVQLIGLNSRLAKGGSPSIATSSNAPLTAGVNNAPPANSNVATPTNSQNLPQMVGGC